MARDYTQSNPAFGGVAAQNTTWKIPEDIELFKTGDNEALRYIKGGKIYTLDPTGFNLSGKNQAEQMADYYSQINKLGIDTSNIQTYNPASLVATYGNLWYGSEDAKKAGLNVGLNDFQKIMQMQAPTNVPITQTYAGEQPTEAGHQALINNNPSVTAAGWQDTSTGQPSPAGVGMPMAGTNQPPAGATYISNPNELKGLKESQIWRDPNSNKIYKLNQATLTSPTGIKKVVNVGSTEANQLLQSGWTLGDKLGGGTVITTQTLTPEPEINLGTNKTPTTSYLADQAIASAKVDTKATETQLQANLALLQTPETDLSKQVKALLGETQTAAQGLTGRGAMQASEEAKMGIQAQQQAITDKTTELNKKLAEVDALTASYQLANQQAEGVPMTLSSLQGRQAQNYKMYLAQKNSLAAEASYLQSELLGMQNKLSQAQSAANRAVELEFSDRQAVYNAKIAQLNILQPQLASEEAKYATALQMTLQQQADALTEAKNNKQKMVDFNLDLMTKYPSAGISINDTPETATQKASKVNTTADYQFISGTENQPMGVFNKTTGQFDDLKAKGVVTDASGSAYNIASYATDPNHEASVQSILNRIGKMTSYEQMDNYIKQVAPNSQITGEMIGNASQKYGVSWETMMAIMQQDSNFGTAGAGARSFNPGNVGNTEKATSTGQLVNFGNWQAGVDAVAKNLAWRKVENKMTTLEEDIEIISHVDLVNQGRETTKDALDKLPEDKRGAFVYQLAQTTSKAEEKKTETTQANAQAKIDTINEVLNSSALNDAVGPNWFARDWGKLDLSKFTGEYQNFVGNVQQLSSQEFIDNLIESKQAGATYGSLTEREGQALREAATKLNNWAKKDKDGNVIGYNVSEKAFIKELEKIKSAAVKVNSNVQVMPDGTQWKLNTDGTLTQIK